MNRAAWCICSRDCEGDGVQAVPHNLRTTDRPNAARQAACGIAARKIAFNSGMQEPQLVPARSWRPTSPTVVKFPAAIASCKVRNPTPKQEQIVRPRSALRLPEGERPDKRKARACGSRGVAKSAVKKSRGGRAATSRAINKHASSRLPTTVPYRKVDEAGSAYTANSAVADVFKSADAQRSRPAPSGNGSQPAKLMT